MRTRKRLEYPAARVSSITQIASSCCGVQHIFSRLWCVYEIACWAHLRQHKTNVVHFVPVVLTPGICVLHGTFLLDMFAFHFRSHLPFTNVEVQMFSIAILGSALVVHKLRQIVHELQQLPEQFSKFSVGDADCFCCHNMHMHPETGENLQCDRQLVYQTMKEWFTDEGQDGRLEDSHLVKFDMLRMSLVHGLLYNCLAPCSL